MGNCVETFASKTREEEEVGETGGAGGGGVGVKGGDVEKDRGGLKVRVVLTRAELEWLLLQLEEAGERSLERVLEEMEKGVGKVKRSDGWKPSLESIMEVPEAQSIET